MALTDMWAPSTIQEQLNHLRNEITASAQQINRARFSEQGYTEELQRHLTPHRARRDELATIIEQWQQTLEHDAAGVYAEQLPESTTHEQRVETELVVARYQRRAKKFTTAELMDMQPSPVRTVLIDEARAAGDLTTDEFLQRLMTIEPDIARAVSLRDKARTLRRVLDEELAVVDHLLAGGLGKPSGLTQAGRVHLIQVEQPGHTVKLPTRYEVK